MTWRRQASLPADHQWELIAELDTTQLHTVYTGRSGIGKYQYVDDNVHDPFGKANFSACHEPHSSERPALLVDSEAAVCESCHENALATHEFPGAADFACGDCHDPHVASSKMPMAMSSS